MKNLSTIHTAPVIISLISFALDNNYSTLTHIAPNPNTRNESIAYMAAMEQQHIGWKNILQGIEREILYLQTIMISYMLTL